MNIKKVFFCNIKIAIQADSEGEASDFMTALLTERLQYEQKTIIDWQYVQFNPEIFSEPTYAGMFDLDDLQEFEVFNAYPLPEAE